MKRDLRKQTFSKPVKPDDDEIKRLTSGDNDNLNPTPKVETSAKKETKVEAGAIKQATPSPKTSPSSVQKTSKEEKINPFLQSRDQQTQISIEKTGYRLRSEYMDLLKLVKRMKKGYTLEAVLDDVLTHYFETSEDGRKAVKQRAILEAD